MVSITLLSACKMQRVSRRHCTKHSTSWKTKWMHNLPERPLEQLCLWWSPAEHIIGVLSLLGVVRSTYVSIFPLDIISVRAKPKPKPKPVPVRARGQPHLQAPLLLTGNPPMQALLHCPMLPECHHLMLSCLGEVPCLYEGAKLCTVIYETNSNSSIP